MAASRSALLTLAALTALAGCCVCAPQGSVQGGVQGGAQVPPVSHSTAPPGVGGVRRERRSIHSASIVDRRCDRSGGVLAIGQLLVAGAGGRAGWRLTRDGGRVHARVAPAFRGAQPRRPGLTVARAAARAPPRLPHRRQTALPALLPPPPVRHRTPHLLTGRKTCAKRQCDKTLICYVIDEYELLHCV